MSNAQCIAIIPARGGSVGVPRKNIKPLYGKPLMQWTIEAAHAARCIDAVWVTTDDAEMAAVARRCGANVISRPAHLATSDATLEDTLSHALGHLSASGAVPEMVAWLHCTSPLTTPADIDGIVSMVRTEGLESAVTGAEFHRWIWRRDEHHVWRGVNHDESQRQMRQDRAPEMLEAGAVYAIRTEAFLRNRYRFGDPMGFYPIPAWRAVEIDEPEDWALAEMLMQHFARPCPGLSQIDLSPVQAVVTDFDGVLTDNRVYVNTRGEETVACNRGDGWGIRMLKDQGIPVTCLSSETDGVVTKRCQKIGIPVEQGLADKGAALQKWAAAQPIDLAHVLYVGNDTNDAECLQAAGVSVVPADAASEVMAYADACTRAIGGAGVLREIASALLATRNPGSIA